MATKKLSQDTSAIISAIESSNRGAQILAEAVRQDLQTHTRLDDARHEENKQTLAAISADVKSLLSSRAYTRGMAKMASIVGALVGAVVTALLAYLRGH